jgi:NAD(P)-dependent dehydrogenase (short-subunit alcohol dehydrogenase family)
MLEFPQNAQLAIVTGGGGDIGRAIAANLIESHDHIVLLDLDEAKTKSVAENLGKDKASVVTCDVTDSKQVQAVAQKISEMAGVVRTLVNNAGGTWVDSLQDMTPELWRRETALNLDAAFFCFHAFQDFLKQSRGSVINIASVNGLSVFGNPAYSAAKAGLIHLTQSMAVEYGKFGVRANAIAPGTVRTQAWEARKQKNPEVFEQVMQWYPLKHVIEPTDIANAVAFLSSEQATAITGVCLPVDSGLMAGHTAIPRSITLSEHF